MELHIGLWLHLCKNGSFINFQPSLTYEAACLQTGPKLSLDTDDAAADAAAGTPVMINLRVAFVTLTSIVVVMIRQVEIKQK